LPRGIIPPELEIGFQCCVRKCLREIGNWVVFPVGETSQSSIEHFAIASFDMVNSDWSQNTKSWVAGWPAVIGAAATDFFPDVATPQARGMVAQDAAAAYLEALLLRRATERQAIEEPDSRYMLPNPAALGIQALGTDRLPAMPDQKKHQIPTMGSGKGEAWTRKHDKVVRSTQHLLRGPSQDPQQTPASESVPRPQSLTPA